MKPEEIIEQLNILHTSSRETTIDQAIENAIDSILSWQALYDEMRLLDTDIYGYDTKKKCIGLIEKYMNLTSSNSKAGGK